MNAVIDHPEARWLPSRHRFALARLIGLAGLRRERPDVEKPDHLILLIDRDQNSAEMHAVAIWVFLTVTSYLAAALPMTSGLAFIAAIPLAFVAIHIPIVGGGLLIRWIAGDRNHNKIVSVGTMVMLVIWSSCVARGTSWARFAAWFFFLVLAGNCLAALILWLLRTQVQAAESRCAR